MFLATLTFLMASEIAGGAPPEWWHADWPYRVRIQCDAGEGDVAYAQVTLAGRTTEDGRDLRMVDSDGRLHNFEVIQHDPQRNTLIQFRAAPKQPLTVWLYYGHAGATRINTTNPDLGAWQETWNEWKQQETRRQEVLKHRRPLEKRLDRARENLREARAAGNVPPRLEQRVRELEQELADLPLPEVGPAPAKPDTWYARRGLVLRVYRKVEPAHPKTLTELRKLARTGEAEGACFTNAISDGFNRFGPSDNYISVYEGYLRVPKTGVYAFCTVSDDGSWVRVNDHTVVEWPGAHGWGGAERGEKNGEIRLKEGVAHVEYFHEEDSGAQMAFLGWKPPDAERFAAIPRKAWLNVRAARATAYEASEKPLLAVAEARVLNTYWVRDSDNRQATLVEFRDRSRSRAGKIVERRWSLGDGLEGSGEKLRHVYFRTGRPDVTLTVTDSAGNRDSAVYTPRVFYVDVRTRYFKFGNARQYTEAAAGYDVERMSREDLQLYAEFWDYLDNWAEHARAADAFVRRFPDDPVVPQFAASAAEACTHAEAYDPQRADALYEIALQGADSLRRRLELNLARARLLAWNLDEYEQARARLNDIVTTIEPRAARAMRRLRRQALLSLGDVALLSGDYKEAERLYREAASAGGQKIEQAEMLAKVGGYGYSVEDLLARDEYDWALRVLERWEDEFPLQKLEGYTFFLRGKVLFVQQPGPLALRYLELAERVAPRAVHVPEAVWLRANCLLSMQRYDEALAQSRRIRVEFTESEFYQRALEKIETCETQLAESERAGRGE